MIKLMPNETVKCEWAGITITNSRIFVQQSSGKNDFSLRQFPAHDYRRIEANFVRGSSFKVLGILMGLAGCVAVGAAFLPNPHASNRVELVQKKTPRDARALLPIPNPTIYEINPRIMELEAKKAEFEKPGFKFFKNTRLKGFDEQINLAKAEAEQKITALRERVEQENSRIEAENENLKRQTEQENARIDQENHNRMARHEALIREADYLKFKTVAGGVLAILFGCLSFYLYSCSGNIRVRIEFNKSSDNVVIRIPLGIKHLPEALNFVSEVDIYLSPINSAATNKAA